MQVPRGCQQSLLARSVSSTRLIPDHKLINKMGEAAGDHRRDRPKGQRGQSQERPKTSNVCTFHLKGRYKAGDKRPKKHNPPCKFVKSPGGCKSGKNLFVSTSFPGA